MLISCLLTMEAVAQTGKEGKNASVFERIAAEMKEFQMDTTPPPDDSITQKIIELRNLGGGFNIHEAIAFKLEEDRSKKEIPETDLKKLETFFKSGDGKRWIDNAAVWIYRKHFNYEDLVILTDFYSTEAGKKMASDFPLIMLKSLTAAEKIKEQFSNGLK
jgi:uncharacterized protein